MSGVVALVVIVEIRKVKSRSGTNKKVTLGTMIVHRSYGQVTVVCGLLYGSLSTRDKFHWSI